MLLELVVLNGGRARSGVLGKGKSIKMQSSQLMRGHLTSSSLKTREVCTVWSWGESKYLRLRLNPSFSVIPYAFPFFMCEFYWVTATVIDVDFLRKRVICFSGTRTNQNQHITLLHYLPKLFPHLSDSNMHAHRNKPKVLDIHIRQGGHFPGCKHSTLQHT